LSSVSLSFPLFLPIFSNNKNPRYVSREKGKDLGIDNADKRKF